MKSVGLAFALAGILKRDIQFHTIYCFLLLVASCLFTLFQTCSGRKEIGKVSLRKVEDEVTIVGCWR